MAMLHSIVISGGSPPQTVQELEEFFNIVAPVFREENAIPHQERTARASALLQGLGVTATEDFFGPTGEEAVTVEEPGTQEEVKLMSKLVHMLDHEDTDVVFEMLTVARNHLSMARAGSALVPIVFSALRLADRIYAQENPTEEKQDEVASEPVAVEETKEETKDEAQGGGEAKDDSNEGLAESDKAEGKESSTEPKEVEEAETLPMDTVVDESNEAQCNVDLDTKESATTDVTTSDEVQSVSAAESPPAKSVR
jgi:vacuolar protein sorting-associated protein 35